MIPTKCLPAELGLQLLNGYDRHGAHDAANRIITCNVL